MPDCPSRGLPAHGVELADQLEELVALPGVGRKTANVVLGNAYGIPGITVDTHVGRLARRFGWTEETVPDRVETDLMALFPPSEWTDLSHRMILHGRRVCHARKPACDGCPLAALCPSFTALPEASEQASARAARTRERTRS